MFSSDYLVSNDGESCELLGQALLDLGLLREQDLHLDQLPLLELELGADALYEGGVGAIPGRVIQRP